VKKAPWLFLVISQYITKLKAHKFYIVFVYHFVLSGSDHPVRHQLQYTQQVKFGETI